MSVEVEGWMPNEAGLFLPPRMLKEEDYQGTFKVGAGGLSDRLFNFMQRSGFTILHGVPESITDEHGSPYSSESAFAIDPQRIDLEQLVILKDLTSGELEEYQTTVASGSRGPVDIKGVKSELLAVAADRFMKDATLERKLQFEAWCNEESEWLDGYAAYQILKEADGNAGKPWQQWQYGRKYAPTLVHEIKRDKEQQFITKCYEQWIVEQQAILYHDTAKGHGIELWGDVPFYAQDVWANRELFNVDAEGNLLSQGGVPEYDKPWQEWGTATYKVDFDDPKTMKKLVDWWTKRLVRAQKICGGKVRLDYFAGFGGAYELPMENVNQIGAPRGRALGQPVMRQLVKMLGKKPPFYVEDLGFIPPEAREILDDRDNYDFLGTKVALFLSQKFGTGEMLGFEHNADNFPREVVAFSSNHDTPSIAKAIETMRNEKREGNGARFDGLLTHLRGNFQSAGIHEGMSNAELTRFAVARVIGSRAVVAMIPVWDAIGQEIQYNIPNTKGPHNWSGLFDTANMQKLEREQDWLLGLNRASGRA